MGTPEFVDQVLEKRVQSLRDITACLPYIKHAQTEFVLLRSCLSLPKILYTLRTLNPIHHYHRWNEVDMITMDALGKIMGVAVTNKLWRGQAPREHGRTRTTLST